MTYAETAKKLGIRFRVWKYGLNWGRGLDDKFRVRIVPLDGWVLEPKEVERVMRERGLEL